jgi:hypothetical protein
VLWQFSMRPLPCGPSRAPTQTLRFPPYSPDRPPTLLCRLSSLRHALISAIQASIVPWTALNMGFICTWPDLISSSWPPLISFDYCLFLAGKAAGAWSWRLTSD